MKHLSNEIIPFNFNGNDVRVVKGEDGEPWFVAKDVATALGYAKPENAIARHCKDSRTTPKRGGGYLTIITERDVYRLIMHSQLPSAIKFEEWVTGTVLSLLIGFMTAFSSVDSFKVSIS